MNTIKNIIEHSEKKMLHTLNHLEEVFSRIRAGKANIHILDGIKMEYYGSMVSLSNIANISILDAKTITILAWEKSMMKPIEKAIQDSDIGITPENNGEIIRLNIPPLTEESRKRLVKQSKEEAEKVKVCIRNIRREVNATIKKSVKESIFSEDERKETEIAIQKLHDKYLKEIDKILTAKEKEIMTV